jgi:hypothetical protein
VPQSLQHHSTKEATVSKKMLTAIAAIALGIAGAVSSAQAGDSQSVAAAQPATMDKGVTGGSGRTHLIIIQRRVRQVTIVQRPLNPVIWDDLEGYPHPK